MRQLQAIQLAERLADAGQAPPLLLDVREPWEFELCRIAGAVSMPMGSVPARLTELDEAADIVLICHHGMRSAQVGLFLEHHGFQNISNLMGGVAAWADQVEPGMPRY